MDEDKKRYREFTVTPGMNGFKVKIGCSELYFSTAQELANAITAYLNDPQGTEQFYQQADQRWRGILPGVEAETASWPERGLAQTARMAVGADAVGYQGCR